MERKFTFKKGNLSSNNTTQLKLQPKLALKNNDENFIKSNFPTSNSSALLSTYSSDKPKTPIKESNKNYSELISNLENQDQTKFNAKTNSNTKTINQFFHKPKQTLDSTNLEYDEECEQDFKKQPTKNLLQPKNFPIFQETPKKIPEVIPVIKKIDDTPPKIEAKKETIKEEVLLNDKEFCPVCKFKYTSAGPKRRLIDGCGHGICFSCVTKNIPCKICDNLQKSNKITENDEEDFFNKTGFSYADVECILNSPEKVSKIPETIPDSPVLVCSKKYNETKVDDEEINFKPVKVKSKEFQKSNKEEVDLVILDSPRPVSKTNNKIKEFDNFLDDEDEECLPNINFDTQNTSTQIPTNSKQIFNQPDEVTQLNDEDDDEDLIIEECDFNSKNNLNVVVVKGVNIPNIEYYEKINWLFNDIKDCSSQFRAFDYEHTDDMISTFRISFGLKSFRPQQFEAVNAALLGLNTFILMPTGGGKSLCYQLPAVVSRGVTFVVSPLKSLIIDQVQKLNGLGLSACHMLSDVDSSECDFVYQELVKQEPRFKLIYITPEKLNNSNKLRNVILNLYNRGMISRLVIDEAHCVSQWGHDFRTDYKKMGELRNTLMPNVPCMLLTATATPRVRNDILMQMRLTVSDSSSTSSSSGLNGFKTAFGTAQNKLESKLSNRNYMTGGSSMQKNNQQCVFFMQSFNRENLQYKVEYKTSNSAALGKISELIKSKYANKSGIVYCISRNECEQVSDHLRKNGIKALPYHAGMDDKKRQEIQHKWTNNIDCKVVCATIAFGMGIDKPDVRYVVHLGLPKSLEGYYQESGRAGRDGGVSLCLLFYNNQDRHKWLRLMQHEQKSPNFNPTAYKTHVDNIYRMAQYCDNQTDCRRAQILEYFGEKFDRRKCIESKMRTICDNCELLEANQCKLVDITNEAIIICRGVQQLSYKEDITLLHLSEILKGSMNSKITEKGHQNLEMHSKLAKYKKNDIERIVRKLIFSEYLKEDVKILQHSETVASYIKIGPKCTQLLNNNKNSTKIEFELIGDENKVKKCKVVNSDNDSDADDNDDGKKSKNKLSDSAAINRLLLRCQSDLKRKIKHLCSEKGVKNMSTLFTPKMLSEMLIRLPETKEDLLGITGYTEKIFSSYKGEEFLTIFKHYAGQKKEIQADELKKMEEKQIEKAKARAVQSQACYKNSKTYGLVDDISSIDYNSSNKWLNSKSTSSNETSSKRKNYNNYSKSYPSNKKARTSYGDDADATVSGSSSTYFNNNNNNNKKKFNFKNKSKFKNYKKKF